jgi:hypothetical protein
MRFVDLKFRILYMAGSAGSLTATATDLARYSLVLLGVQEVTLHKASRRSRGYNILYVK